jgi:aminopeptidase YwaD
MGRTIAIFVAILIFSACTSGTRVEITAGELSDHVAFIASDALGGRYTGTTGIAEAEEYIADTFAAMGLSPLPGEKDFFLDFELRAVSYDQKRTLLTINGAAHTLGEDFKPFSFSSEGESEAEVVFAGYGITAPEYDYDDYEGLDVEGRIVLVMRHEPDESGSTGRFEGKRHTSHAYFRTKAKNAAAHGAVGMLLYTDPLHHIADDDMRIRPVYEFASTGAGGDTQGSTGRRGSRATGIQVADGFIAFHISRGVAGTLLPGMDLQTVQKEVDLGKGVSDIPRGDASMPLVHIGQFADPIGQIVKARNIAAFLPGTNPKKSEWIVVGAHHDHIGSFPGDGDTIYNGADDNASGVAGVIELAEQFAYKPTERPMVFMTFSAEEIGLYGSYALDEFDLIDLSDVGFMLNLDMIGRNPGDPILLYGDGLAEGLTTLVLKANEKLLLDLDLQGDTYEPFSDIAVFHDNRIPFLMLYTGEHDDYHGTGDHAEKLDFNRMEKLLQLSYDILDLAAKADRLPGFKK